MDDRDATFGLSPEARYYIDKAAEAAATKAVEKPAAGDCPFDCGELRGVKATLYGMNGKSGLTRDVTRIEEQVSGLVWWNRATIVAALSAVAAVIASLLSTV